MDDSHDSSIVRRGGDTAHVAMHKYLGREGIGRAPEKLGTDSALTAGFIMHVQAGQALGRLAVPGPHKELAADIAAECLIQTGIGQLRDLLPNPAQPPTPAAILETYRLKTGVYTFYLPLAVGAALAGASAAEVKLFTRYAEAAGQAFQLHDDVLGIVGDPEVTGKPQKSDIAEGKYTWPMVTALERADTPDRQFLLRSLGNAALGDNEFYRCRAIIEETDAIADAQSLVGNLTQNAVNALDVAPDYWPAKQVIFMRDLAVYGGTRQA
jgi:geranylgeranyl diphosphate synthase type I